MALLSDIYNTAMGRPSFGSQQNLNRFNKPMLPSQPQSTGPKKLDLRGGVYNDPSRFDSNFRYRVQEDLKGTLRDSSTRSAVAGVFHESRGGNGVTKGEIKDGLNRLVKEGKINEDQMWAVRKKYGVF